MNKIKDFYYHASTSVLASFAAVRSRVADGFLTAADVALSIATFIGKGEFRPLINDDPDAPEASEMSQESDDGDLPPDMPEELKALVRSVKASGGEVFVQRLTPGLDTSGGNPLADDLRDMPGETVRPPRMWIDDGCDCPGCTHVRKAFDEATAMKQARHLTKNGGKLN